MPGGRPSDPTRARRQTGHRRKPGEAPAPAKGLRLVTDAERGDFVVEPPADLPEGAHEIWNVAIAELSFRGLKAVDLEAIRQMCVAAMNSRSATAEVAKYGYLVEGMYGPIVNPMLKVARDEAALYQRLAQEFGLTLASRMRLGLVQLAGVGLSQQLSASLESVPAARPRKVANTAKKSAKKPAKKTTKAAAKKPKK